MLIFLFIALFASVVWNAFEQSKQTRSAPFAVSWRHRFAAGAIDAIAANALFLVLASAVGNIQFFNGPLAVDVNAVAAVIIISTSLKTFSRRLELSHSCLSSNRAYLQAILLLNILAVLAVVITQRSTVPSFSGLNRFFEVGCFFAFFSGAWWAFRNLDFGFAVFGIFMSVMRWLGWGRGAAVSAITNCKNLLDFHKESTARVQGSDWSAALSDCEYSLRLARHYAEQRNWPASVRSSNNGIAALKIAARINSKCLFSGINKI